MNAMVAILNRDAAPAQPETLCRMLKILEHRGGDAVSVWHEGPVGLGNGRLATTRASLNERMPATGGGGSVVITADARLDNREELWRRLGRSGSPGEEVTDSEIILASYQLWGEDCPSQLLGDFAFIIWDHPRRRLFCARDPLGVKPFYFHCSDRIFAAASEIKAILQVETVDRSLDETWIGDYLADAWIDKTYTIRRAVRRLAPAHTLVVDRDGLATRRYWALDSARELRVATEQEYVDGFRELFFDAVRVRLRSAGPVGVSLSGGMDSSSIACVARHLGQREGGARIHSFSAVFPAHPACDESAYIQSVLAQNGLHPHRVALRQTGSLADHERKAWHLDQPLSGYNSQLGWMVLDSAREAGVGVMLDGTDGDSTVSDGTGFLRDLAREGDWPSVVAELRSYRRLHDTPFWGPLATAAWQFGVKPRVPAPLRSGWRSLRGRATRGGRGAGSPGSEAGKGVSEELDPDFVRRIGLADRLAARARDGRSTTAREAHWKMLEAATLPMLLELSGQMAAAFGVEKRYPFCDRRLVEYCLALPTRWKQRRGLGRYILRRALADLLPEAVAARPDKADFTSFFQEGLQRPDARVLKELLNESCRAIEPFVKPGGLGRIHDRWTRGRLDVLEARRSWRIVALALWLKGDANQAFSRKAPCGARGSSCQGRG